MKLVLAIVNNDDSSIAASALTEAGFTDTNLSTTGGFLMVGNTTLLIGVEDKDTQRVIDTLKRHCTTRKQAFPSTASFGLGMQHMSIPNEITVGGATIFVLDVSQLERI